MILGAETFDAPLLVELVDPRQVDVLEQQPVGSARRMGGVGSGEEQGGLVYRYRVVLRVE